MSLTRSSNTPGVPTFPGYLMLLPTTVILVRLGSALPGRTSHMTRNWEISFRRSGGDIGIFNSAEGFSAFDALLLCSLVALTYALSRPPPLVGVGSEPCRRERGVVLEVAVFEGLSGGLVEYRVGKVEEERRRIFATGGCNT